MKKSNSTAALLLFSLLFTVAAAARDDPVAAKKLPSKDTVRTDGFVAGFTVDPHGKNPTPSKDSVEKLPKPSKDSVGSKSRSHSHIPGGSAADPGANKPKESKESASTNSYIPGFGADPGGFFGGGGGGGFSFPGFGGSWGAGMGGGNWGGGSWGGGGWGGGFGGPSGGSNHDGVMVPSVVCSDWGPCYKKKLTCPASCFTSYSHSGNGYGGGGGGGGCTIDCKKHCVAYC